MEYFNQTVRLKQWQALLLLLMSGFATGAILVRLVTALGF